MKVPRLELLAQHQALAEDIQAAAARVFAHGRFILGPEVGELEGALAAYVGAAHAVGCASGSDALLLSLLAEGTGPGDAVITTAYSFFATAGAIARAGATPVFIDIEPDSFHLDRARLEEYLRSCERDAGALFDPRSKKRVRALLPVHLFGAAVRMEPLLALAREYSLFVIEDAAQAIGARDGAPRACSRAPDRAEWCGSGPARKAERQVDALASSRSSNAADGPETPSSATERGSRTGPMAGALGEYGCLSFFPSKNLGGAGDGGMIFTSDPARAERLRALRVHGAVGGVHVQVGLNSRLDTLQAAILLAKLPYLDELTQKRAALAHAYLAALRDLPGLRLPLAQEGAVWNQFVIRHPAREALRVFLEERGVETAVYYPTPLPYHPCFSDLGYQEGSFPAAEAAARESLALPLFPEMSASQQEWVVACVREFLGGWDRDC